MSAQFGRWDFAGQVPSPEYMERVGATLAPYGPDSSESYSKGGVNIVYRAFYTTKESHREKQPYISRSGAVITWDGRLDNRADLIKELREPLTMTSTDLAIVAAANDKWGANCFAKLIGDWALSIWNPGDCSLTLAKDFVGTRHLYYSIDKEHVTWSTILDPLVLFARKTFSICEEYIAGWFSYFPAAHLTPYVGIDAVPPSSFVQLRLLKDGIKHRISKYWDFNLSKRIRYDRDAEYEDHFVSVLAKAVQRRLRSDRPVLAELSGGMDSSSIVCMADLILARGQAECPHLDTISWYDSSNPAWDDLVYLTKVEERRGRSGCHIDLSAEKRGEDRALTSENSFLSEFESDRFAATPASWRYLSSELFKQAAAHMKSGGHRVILSGVGGEQPTGGGVPTPKPELQNLLARARFITLARQLKSWAAKMNKRPLPLLGEALRGFCSVALVGTPKEMHLVSWFTTGFAHRNVNALCAYRSRRKLVGPLPSLQEQLELLNCERRFMAYVSLSPDLLHEVRYPYHDRDLREFAYAIPREQIVRVGQRRSLMKRALVGIVPDEVLNRKQKSFAQPEQTKQLSTPWPSADAIGQYLVCGSIGLIDSKRFLDVLHKARRFEEVPVRSVRATLTIESWLRHLRRQGVLRDPSAIKSAWDFDSLENSESRPSARANSSAVQ